MTCPDIDGFYDRRAAPFQLNNIIKEHAMGQFRDGDKKVEIKGSIYTWSVSRSETTTIDKKALEADGLLDKYQKKSEQYRMTVK